MKSKTYLLTKSPQDAPFNAKPNKGLITLTNLTNQE